MQWFLTMSVVLFVFSAVFTISSDLFGFAVILAFQWFCDAFSGHSCFLNCLIMF